MDTSAIIGAHARRLMVTPEGLTQALLTYAAGELTAWVGQQEETDSGSVWETGDAPEWLKPLLLTEGELWVLGYYDDLIRAIRRKYPAASVLRKLDVIESWRQGAFPGCQLEVA